MNQFRKIYNNKVNVYFDHVNPYVINYVKSNKTILDVGCASGELGSYLKKHLNSKVYGIDVSNKAIKNAKSKLDKALVCNIETDKLPFKNKFFDIIICGDVLEHLFDPELSLIKLKRYLKDDGYIILSVPNVANIEIRWNLLRGKFDYQKSGILDNSHLRFFTKNTLLKMIDNCKFKVERMSYTSGFSFYFLKDKTIQKFPILLNVKEWLNKIYPTLTCRQFVVFLRKI